ncbi:MAG TPA: DUF3788 family protein [Candidatus Kryptonia bacterium]
MVTPNPFPDKAVIPDEMKLLKILGDTGKFWREIRSYIEKDFGPVKSEWKFYSEKSGWTMKLLLKKRNLFFLSPVDGGFRMSFIFGDKAVSAIEESDIPKKIIDEVRNAKKYVEGRGIRMEVKSAKTVEIVKKLIKIKIEN